MTTERLIPLAELEAILRDDTAGVRVRHAAVETWGHWHGRPDLAFVDPAVRDQDQFVRLVGALLPLAVIDEQVTIERVNEAGTVVASATLVVRDRTPENPRTGFSDLFLAVAPGA